MSLLWKFTWKTEEQEQIPDDWKECVGTNLQGERVCSRVRGCTAETGNLVEQRSVWIRVWK